MAGTRRQAGLALLTTLIFLLAIVLLALGTMQAGLLQARSTGDRHDWHLAFQAAEAALRDGELDVATRDMPAHAFDDACTAGLCLAKAGMPQALMADGTLGLAIGSHSGQAAPGPADAPTPRYVVERLQTPPESVVMQGYGAGRGGLTVYRVTAIGAGVVKNPDGSPASQVVLQSNFIP